MTEKQHKESLLINKKKLMPNGKLNRKNQQAIQTLKMVNNIKKHIQLVNNPVSIHRID